MEKTSLARKTLTAFAVHMLTASGGAVAFVALAAAIDRDFSSMFAWLALALFIDGVDGALARLADVERHAAWIKGEVLDLVVDFVTYVFVPAVALWRSNLLPSGLAFTLCAFIVAASALYFADKRMKMEGNWFRGFPALWNVAILYLFVFRPPSPVSAVIVAALIVLMFAPVAFVHPIRVRSLRALTLAMTLVWLASAAFAVVDGLEDSLLAKIGLALSGAYYIGLSLWRSLMARASV